MCVVAKNYILHLITIYHLTLPSHSLRLKSVSLNVFLLSDLKSNPESDVALIEMKPNEVYGLKDDCRPRL